MYLEQIDTERIFRTAAQQGFRFCEIYCELIESTDIQWHDKLQHPKSGRQFGVALRCSNGKTQWVAQTNQLRTEALLSLMGMPTKCSTQSAHQKHCTHNTEAVPSLGQTVRKAFDSARDLEFATFEWRQAKRTFEVQNCLGQKGEGKESSFHAKAQWLSVKGETRNHFVRQWSRLDGQKLLNELTNENAISLAIEQSEQHAHRWPAPTGAISIVWSPTAVAKLFQMFLLGFHGQHVRNRISFLERHPEIQVGVTLREPERLHPSVDQEGCPRRFLTLFESSRPAAVLCDRKTAQQLSIRPTGHCRRNSYLSPPTIGTWHCVVEPEKTTQGNLLESAPSAISVQDIEVIRFDVQSGMLTARLEPAALVHAGKQGEFLVAPTMELSLVRLLERMELFSNTPSTTGIQSTNHPSIVSEIQAPAAFSPDIPIQGSVPKSYYW